MNISNIIDEINKLSIDDKVNAINDIRTKLHEISPFKNNPVDLVIWAKSENVVANDYNPNEVAPPEMELLEVSILNDGYTQPIVGWKDDKEGQIVIVDGFHRNRVGRESKIVSKGLMGYLPVVNIRKEQQGKNDRIASTIRHNRARGKHKVDAMSEIVIELKNRNWKNEKISKELGMDEEEVLRLLQISGLQEMFKDDDFSRSWNAEGSVDEFEGISDELTQEEIDAVRVINVDDNERIFHTYGERECFKNGFYATTVEGKSKEQCEKEFADFFNTPGLFEEIANKVIVERKNSCEHYLTNKSMNRIAWLGQASVCYKTGIPNKYSSGWFLLDNKTQEEMNLIALNVINTWRKRNNLQNITMKEAMGGDNRQVNIY